MNRTLISFSFPLTTLLLVSAIVSVIAWLLRR
jgi:hypothetical protein